MGARGNGLSPSKCRGPGRHLSNVSLLPLVSSLWLELTSLTLNMSCQTCKLDFNPGDSLCLLFSVLPLDLIFNEKSPVRVRTNLLTDYHITYLRCKVPKQRVLLWRYIWNEFIEQFFSESIHSFLLKHVWLTVENLLFIRCFILFRKNRVSESGEYHHMLLSFPWISNSKLILLELYVYMYKRG